MTVWTIGHSTHTFEAFVRLLAMHDISLLADIRTVPKSRRHPHFNGLAQLCELAAAQSTAMMCAEALWWRCHRRLVADRLVVAGDTVCHIGADWRASAHHLTALAEVSADGELTYPASTWWPD